jgi:tetratricopeptide (TPR) repeat protein
MAQRLFKGDHALLADTLVNLARLMMKAGRHADALPPAAEARDMQRRLFGPASRESADALVTLTAVLMALDRKAEAEPLLRELLGLLEAQHPDDHSHKAGAMAHLARCLNSRADPAAHAEALDLARRAADMARRILPEGQAVRTRCEKTLAEIESTDPAEAAQEQPAK